MRSYAPTYLAVLGVVAAVGIVHAASRPQAPPPPSKFRLSSPDYGEGNQIPAKYTCADPKMASPALEWTDAPKDTASFALIFHDTDAAPKKNSLDVTHWILWNIPGSAGQLLGGIEPNSSPQGILQGQNIRGANGYQGPCPPPGSAPHHYIFELYALDQKLDLPAGSSRADLLKAMDGHVIGKATYVGVFSR